MATFTATLLENERLAPKTFVLHLGGCEPLRYCRPGQFVMLRGQWGRDPLLPRAFSVMAVDDEGEQAPEGWVTSQPAEPLRDDSLVVAKAQLNDAVEELLFLGNHTYAVRLTTAHQIPVGRKYYAELQRRLRLDAVTTS